MKVSFYQGDLQNWSGSILVIGLTENNQKKQLEPFETLINTQSLIKSLEESRIKGKKGDLFSFQFLNEKIKKLIVVSLGREGTFTSDDFRQASSSIARANIGSVDKISIFFPWSDLNPTKTIKVFLEGFRLTNFKDSRFRSKPELTKSSQEIEFLNLHEIEEDLLKDIEPICSGVELARELVGSPPNTLTPNELANQARKISSEYNLEINILNKQDCQEKKMGAYLAVSQGSDLEPQFIHIIYKPSTQIKKRVAIVGKGLTFDSGGYNLKVGAAQIEKMKYDMGGSASVLGAARAIAELKPKNIEIHFIVAACENMINGSALHPGDIITASNGKTIEVNNTDAEGRLTLADALIYACALNPDSIIDLATLTGACVIALGDEIAGLWTENDDLAAELSQAADCVGEGLWRMPMRNSYKKGLKSMLADLQNTGPRAGGSITAALFLREFVDESVRWAHIDIAGTCWTDKDNGINPAGATGYGVRTLVSWIKELSIDSDH